MEEITTEAEWLMCEEPMALARYARGRIDSQRFRWLALDWGRRIKNWMDSDEEQWFDAYGEWVAGVCPHPSEIYPDPEWYPLMTRRGASGWAEKYIEAIRRSDPLHASARAAMSAADDYPSGPRTPADFAHTHRRRSNKHRVAEKAQAQAKWEAEYAALKAHSARVRQEFCEQFRDVAGNPFRPVVVQPEWRTDSVVGIARAIDSVAAFDRLPILADALQDAGCEDALLLDHCRGPGPHVRGCWVVAELLAGVQPGITQGIA